MTRRLWVIAAGGALLAALVAGVVVAARSGRDGSAAPSTAPPAETTVAAAATTLPATLAPGTLPPTVGTPAPTTRPTAPSTTATAAATTVAVAPTTTARATSAPAGPTTTGRRGATTTTDPDAVPAFPCVPAGLLKAYAASQKVPAGATIGSVQCYGLFAGAVLTAPNVGSVFALFGPGQGAWQLLNAGSAYVCQPYEIPDPAYTVIGCPAWDR